MLKGTLTPLEKEEFVREVKIMKQLRSEYVMQLDGVCFEPEISCIIMKYMKGGTLTDHLKKAPLTPLQKHHLALGIALGLHYLHNKGIIHRDLKGANILIDERGNPRIADYGLSKALNSPSIMTISKQAPALEWLAPEIALAEDNQAHTHKTDIYSYGTYKQYEKAIHLGHNKAKTNLAYFYLRGQGALPQDKKIAHTLFLEAAQGGHLRAMQELAKQFSLGDGVPKNESQAKFWQQKSKETQ